MLFETSTRKTQAHLLLPRIHRLLELLLVLEQHDVHHTEVRDGILVPLEILPDLQSDQGRRDVEGVQLDDVRGLWRNRRASGEHG